MKKLSILLAAIFCLSSLAFATVEAKSVSPVKNPVKKMVTKMRKKVKKVVKKETKVTPAVTAPTENNSEKTK